MSVYMIANYHTHSSRCGHASGTEREYVEKAIERGVKILGFSDHAPHNFPEGYVSGARMPMRMLEDYVDSVNAVKKEYAKEIEIHLGLEAEYYPDYFEGLLQYVKDYGIEYMILGQHHLGNEMGESYVSIPKEEPEMIRRYCEQVKIGMETGVFTYLAHPDLVRDMGRPDLYQKEMRELCRTANRCGLPVEINLLGIRDHRHYPNEDFWRIAGEEKCRVILGADAHTPEDVCRPDDISGALDLVEKYHLHLIDTVKLVNPFCK